MQKRTCMLVAFHALAITGIAAGYAYLIKENNCKTKVDFKSIKEK